MNEYLFSQSLLIVFSMLSGILGFLLYKYICKKLSPKFLIILFILCVIIFGFETLLISNVFGLGNTPSFAYVLIFILDFTILSASLIVRKDFKLLKKGLPAFIALFLLLAFNVNDYYQYYPNINSIFTKGYVRSLNSSSESVVKNSKQNNSPTIEQSLFGTRPSDGRIVTVKMPGTVSHFKARAGYVYLPPAYYYSPLSSVKFPVMVLLAGVPGDPSNWLQGGLLFSTMNTFASHHEGVAPIIVIADQSGSFTKDTECLNSSQGNAETYLTVDVPNYIKSHFRVSSNPIDWGIGGFSEGGMCGAMLTLTHQNLFRHFLDISGDPNPYLNNYSQTLPVLFHNSKKAQQEHGIDWLLRNDKLQPGITAQFAIGDTDSKKLVREMKQTYSDSKKRGIPSSIEFIANGGHDFSTWSQSFSDALPKLSNYLGATEN